MADLTKFFGLGKRKTPAEIAAAAAAGDRVARAAAGGKNGKKAKPGEGGDTADDDDDDEEDEEDEDEDDAENDDDRKAVHRRNALRAAGHRRGVAAEQSRLAVIFNGLDPDRAASAVTVALDPNMAHLSGAQARAFVENLPVTASAPAGGPRAPFAQVMDRIAERSVSVPSAPSNGDRGGHAGPTLSQRMAERHGIKS